MSIDKINKQVEQLKKDAKKIIHLGKRKGITIQSANKVAVTTITPTMFKGYFAIVIENLNSMNAETGISNFEQLSVAFQSDRKVLRFLKQSLRKQKFNYVPYQAQGNGKD